MQGRIPLDDNESVTHLSSYETTHKRKTQELTLGYLLRD
jgi:hypothetical protein